MKTPNAFLVGAAKSGTSSLAACLAKHPNIFFSDPKEPNCFASDLNAHSRHRDLESYLALFQDAGSEHRVVAEGSTAYLPSLVAAEAIANFAPDARIIALLRDPLDMLPSYHAQMLLEAEEDQRSLARAWKLEAERREGRSLPRSCRIPRRLFYSEIARYAEQLDRYKRRFPPERVLALLFDDLLRDPQALLGRCLEFLELPRPPGLALGHDNPRRAARSSRVNAFAQRPPVWLARPAMRLKERLGLERLGLLDWLRRLNTAQGREGKPGAELRRAIVEAYAEDVGRLARCLDRDLSHWLGGGWA